MSRPRTFTAERRRTFLRALEHGHSRTAAAGIAGLSRASLWRELQDEGFQQTVELHEAQAAAAAVGTIMRAIAQGSWRAAIAFLERRFAEDWRLRQEVQVTGQGGGPLAVMFGKYAQMSPDELEAEIRELDAIIADFPPEGGDPAPAEGA